MTAITKITCDTCNTDLSQTGSRPAYRIRLTAEAIPHMPGIGVSTVFIKSPLDKDKHFCNILCLFEWVDKEVV